MSEPCFQCRSEKTGPDANTPIGICEACACNHCRGFRFYDDRGFLCTGQPFFDKKPCPACKGEGLRTTSAVSPPDKHGTRKDDAG